MNDTTETRRGTMTRHPQTISTREQFDATEFEVGVVYLDNGRLGACHVRREGSVWTRSFVDGSGTWYDCPLEEVARYLPLTLVSEPAVAAEPKTKPATPEVTDGQRAAYAEMERVRNLPSFAAAWAIIAPLLPSDLTDPQPVLPTEPGSVIRVLAHAGNPVDATALRASESWAVVTKDGKSSMWLTDRDITAWEPLVPEREPITVEKVAAAVRSADQEWMRSSHKWAEHLHAALVNGADQ